MYKCIHSISDLSLSKLGFNDGIRDGHHIEKHFFFLRFLLPFPPKKLVFLSVSLKSMLLESLREMKLFFS